MSVVLKSQNVSLTVLAIFPLARAAAGLVDARPDGAKVNVPCCVELFALDVVAFFAGAFLTVVDWLTEKGELTTQLSRKWASRITSVPPLGSSAWSAAELARRRRHLHQIL
jgi:hypothetical protein